MIGGYLLYSFLKQEFKLIDVGIDAPLEVPKALKTDLYQNAGFLSPKSSALKVGENNGWSLVEDDKRRYNLVSTKKGDKITLSSTTREITISYHYSKELRSQVQVSVDGSVIDTLSNHFALDWGGGFLKIREIYEEVAPSEHQIEFLNLTGGKFDLRYVLYAE